MGERRGEGGSVSLPGDGVVCSDECPGEVDLPSFTTLGSHSHPCQTCRLSRLGLSHHPVGGRKGGGGGIWSDWASVIDLPADPEARSPRAFLIPI